MSPTYADSNKLAPSLTLIDTPVLGGTTQPVAWQSGQPVPSFVPQNRSRLDLSGEWQKQRVHVNTNLTLAPRDETGIAALEAEAEGRHTAGYDDNDWVSKALPMVENRMPRIPGDSSGPENYEGGVWYRRSIAIPSEWNNSHISLTFLAVNYVVDLWINGQWIGYHEGGYTPFALDVSSALNSGEVNVIALRIDNPSWNSRSDIVPAVKPDWWNYTGVIHDVYLESTPPLYIVRSDVRTPDTSGMVQVDVIVHNTSDTARSGHLTVQAYTADQSGSEWLTEPFAGAIAGEAVGDPASIQISLDQSEALVIPVELHIPRPQIWRPGNPNLYVLKVSLSNGERSEDTAFYQFGIRTIAAEGHRLMLNDDPVFLAGIARHEEWPDSGRTATWDRILSDLQVIQGLGANFVRTAHYPNHIYTYLLTDRLGLLTAVEIPLWQATALEYHAQEERQIADQMWREMIFSNSNCPSIIFWSSNNESREVRFRTRYIERLLEDFHTNYPDGRLVMQSAAADCPGPGDESQALLDVAGWTMYFGIFHGATYYDGTRDFLLQAHEAFPDHPIIDTEYGIWSQGGGSDMERQVEVFDETFRALTEFTLLGADGEYNPDGFVAGIVWWTAFDWYTARTTLQTMGLFHMDRKHAKPVRDHLVEAYNVWNR